MPHRIVVTRRCLDRTERGVGLPAGVAPRTISLDEWLAHVGSNPALVPVRLAANEEDALRAAHPVRLVDRSTDRWLYWASGEIRANGSDPALLGVMLQIARALGARMRTDDGEYFRGADHLLPARPAASATPRTVAPRGPGAARSGPLRITASRPSVHRLGIERTRAAGIGVRADERTGDEVAREEERAERRSAQALLVAGTLTVVCAASVVWMMQA